jgi:hypothetical protein
VWRFNGVEEFALFFHYTLASRNPHRATSALLLLLLFAILLAPSSEFCCVCSAVNGDYCVAVVVVWHQLLFFIRLSCFREGSAVIT